VKEREELLREEGKVDHLKIKRPLNQTPNAFWQGSMSQSRLNTTSGLSRCSRPGAMTVMLSTQSVGLIFSPQAYQRDQ
jgi:hypothetical protein